MDTKFDPEVENIRIVSFLKKVFKENSISKVVIGLSGGIDSATSLFLLKNSIEPKNIFCVNLFYFEPETEYIKKIIKSAQVPLENLKFISIKKTVDALIETQNLNKTDDDYNLRRGNMMSRTRMIILFDEAKKMNALVCGTENKTERFLGYFTRFGDAASDIEPITHLYKNQIYDLAEFLGVPEETIERTPSAGLWNDQTDEKEMGFTYAEADQVLNFYFDQNKPLSEIIMMEFKNAEKIIDMAKKNAFKHIVPYSI